MMNGAFSSQIDGTTSDVEVLEDAGHVLVRDGPACRTAGSASSGARRAR